jgi:RHS repeat-associated protein
LSENAQRLPAGCDDQLHSDRLPGYRTTAWHHDVKEPDIRTWWGGLVDGMRDASGQQYKRNRYYDPATGQFTQPDPIGIAGGLNSYGFAAGDPVSYSDPYGLCPKKAAEGSVCLDFYIAAGRAGPLKGDNRGTDPNAPASESRIQVVANGDGAITYKSASGTCRVTGGCSAPRGFSRGQNEVSSTAHG